MPPPGFFSARGLFCKPGFLSASQCAELRGLGGSLDLASAPVYEHGQEQLVEDARRTKRATLPADKVSELRSVMLSRMDEIATHFRVTLVDCQEPQLLVYKPGDFYVAHTDASHKRPELSVLTSRRISLVIFLNGHSPTDTCPESFEGGELTFFGLIQKPGFERAGLGLEPDEGLAVAFPSTMVHQVPVVTAGKRYSIVTWFT